MADHSTPPPRRPGRPRGTRPGDDGLTDRQRSIVTAIRTATTGYPSSIREIGTAVGLTRTSSAIPQYRRLYPLAQRSR
ncbi:hypothetical protein [Kitasatospora sp. MAP5-34]|uniref:LexA family protein n=1 Tax=Kitasatospora sp. MAP5-34 TaxID=3035102 RepID=UPI0024769D5E|nr:hypothetical protein [Kitasatospora sp. MAP5-34]MDH6580254.1 hypothetical protein [Kitasatospora sp. MAP5-34]